MTLSHFSISLLIRLVRWSGVVVVASRPRLLSFSLMSGNCITFVSSEFNLLIMPKDVPAGANIAFHDKTSYVT